MVDGLNVIAVEDLRQAAAFLEGEIKPSPTHVDLTRAFAHPDGEETDFADVKG